MTGDEEYDIWRGAKPRPRVERDIWANAYTTPCSLGVGCDEMGICYAEAHGVPENCPHYRADKHPRRGLIIALAALHAWALVGAAVYALTVASS